MLCVEEFEAVAAVGDGLADILRCEGVESEEVVVGVEGVDVVGVGTGEECEVSEVEVDSGTREVVAVVALEEVCVSVEIELSDAGEVVVGLVVVAAGCGVCGVEHEGGIVTG